MNKAKISKNRENKVAIVAEIKEKITKSKAVVFTNYQGITHKQLEQFKKDIKKSDAQFLVAKNTLLKLALGKVADELTRKDQLQNQTGAMFLYNDVVAPLKILAKMIKELEKPQVKFGILNGLEISREDVLKLATLPNRETLIAQMLGLMQSPMTRFVKGLNWNLIKLDLTLKAIANKKQ